MIDQNNQSNKLYFPLLYKYVPLFSMLSMEEFGTLIYTVLVSGGSKPLKHPLDGKLEAIGSFIITDAEMLFAKNLPKQRGGAQPVRESKGEKEKEPKPRYGDFDAEEAFYKALARTYSGAGEQAKQ